MGLFINITENQVELQRISLKKNQLYDKQWLIDIPINTNNFWYKTDPRSEQAMPHHFEGDNKIELIKAKVGQSTIY